MFAAVLEKLDQNLIVVFRTTTTTTKTNKKRKKRKMDEQKLGSTK